jgi:Skp family chaperone for outer membrane proteins
MRLSLRASAALLTAMTVILPAHFARAQSPGWFTPPAAQDNAAPAPAKHARAAAPTAEDTPPMDNSANPGANPSDGGDQDAANAPLPDLPHPSVPAVADIAKEAPPPTAVIGVLSIPDVMRQSNAYAIVQRLIGGRRQKLQAEADQLQAHWRELSNALQNDAPKLTPAQGRERERALRERVIADRRHLAAENRVIDEAAAIALDQIQRTLEDVVKKISVAHGMNLVLHRSQIVLNQPELDVTDETISVLNKTLPTVAVPAEDVDPAKLPKDWNGGSATPK